MRIFLASLLVIIAATLHARVAEPADTPASQAENAYAEHRWTEAEQAYGALTTSQPDNARFWYRLGVSARANQHYDRALDAFGHAKTLGEGKGLPAYLADYEISTTYAAKGDASHAFESLNVAVAAGFQQTDRLKHDSAWDALRTDPQFAGLLKKVQHNAAPCEDDPNYHQFDFWAGDWDVTLYTGGPRVGESHIERTMAGCVVWENWTANSGNYGKSYNTWNQSLQRWEQYWVDSTAGVIFFHGVLKDGVMDYYTDDIPQSGGTHLRRHLQFIPIASGKVRQLSQGSNDGGKTWTVEYDFLYTKKQSQGSSAN